MNLLRTFAIIASLLLFLQCSSNREQDSEQLTLTDEQVANNNTFDSLITIAWEQLANNPDTVRVIVDEASHYLSEGDKARELALLNLVGITYFIQSSYEKALEKYTQGLALALEIEDHNKTASFYNNIGIINLHNGQYMDALAHLLKALDFYEKNDDPFRNINTLNNLGMLYSTIENYEMAVLHLDKAYQGFSQQNDSLGLAAVNNSRGAMFLKKQKPDSALFYLDKSIEMAILNNNRFGLSGSYIEKAKVYSFTGEWHKMLEYFTESEKISSEINYQEKLCEAKIGIAQALMNLGQNTEALEYADEAMVIAGQLANNKLMKEIHQFYSIIYERTEDYKLSLFHKNISIEIGEKIIDQSKLHQFYTMEIQHLSLAREIQMLEIQRQELQLGRKNAAIFFISTAFLMITAGLFLLYRNYRYRQLAKHQSAILDLTEKKSRAASEAEIQERARIGRELHDGLGQMLSVARMNISVVQQKSFLDEERRNDLLESALLSVDKAFHELRDISHNLAPSVLAKKGFGSALKELSEQVNKSQQMQVVLELFGLDGPMDNLIENTLYRAIQELLNNAIKHSQAKRFFLQIVKNQNEIILIVEDNGKGFDYNEMLLRQGGGLKNIRSRVENLNGAVFIDAMHDRGTIVSIIIPFHKLSANNTPQLQKV